MIEKSSKERNEIIVYAYDNYQKFLKDFYLKAKAQDKKFSFRFFARIAGFKSAASLHLVMNGQAHVSPESVERLAKAMKLNKEETEFFANLVLFNKSKNSDERQRHATELIRSKTYRKIYPLKESQYHYYSHWYFSVVRALVEFPNFKEDPKWIAQKINPAITPAEAKYALEELLKLGLLQRNTDGKLSLSNTHISTPDEVVSSAAAQFHKDVLKKTAESIDNVPRDKRDLSTVTLGISLETAKKIKEMVQAFRKDVIEVASRTSDPEAVYQLNFHLFPLTEVNETDTEES